MVDREVFAMQTDWVVYVKPPFAGPGKLLGYLGRYVKRVAISNDLLICLKDGKVKFHYRDYADKSRKKTMELTVEEFIRRFLQHVLPARFCKVRYYGILATRYRHTRPALCHALLNSYYQRAKNKAWWELLGALTGQNPLICPHCRTGHWIIVDWWAPKTGSRAPPRLVTRPMGQHLKPENLAS
jgi:hypothetical protein